MAQFEPAFEIMMANEGGYKLTNDPVDRGGQTYAGISRRSWPQWSGWAYIDRGEIPPTQMVRDFYKTNFWDVIRGDEITDNRIASSIFNFAVNTGIKVAVKLAQIVVGVAPDGSLGEKTLTALNASSASTFIPNYTIAKIARYRDIVKRDPTQKRFLLGWINRSLEGIV